jgi:2-polyprenyl-3-methyl-5-hydroxy-6-metoxy-1,4-benzoquinol methylase
MRASGIEIGAEVSERARNRGLDVRTGTLRDAFGDLQAERFDLITFWDVLEHLRDPRHELSLAAALLAEEGVVAATLPNVEGWYPRVTYRLLAKPTGHWEYPEPVHLYDFSPRTLELLFEKQGYEIDCMRTLQTPFEFYRQTTLSIPHLGWGRRAVAMRGCFEALRFIIYPLARMFDRGNSMFVTASRRRRG